MITDELASRHLGKKSDGSVNYDPSLLVAIPRIENRTLYNIAENNLPFEGFDIWHSYEFSALTKNRLPITRVLKIKYNCNSKFLIESKSLKLYLNSFNMTAFGNTTEECLKICSEKIKKDLSEKLQTEIELNFLDPNTERIEIFKSFKNITDLAKESEIKIEHFKEAPEVLRTENIQNSQEHYLTFDSLRSNCRVTHQPDFGDVFIYYKSHKHIIEDSLIKYLISFRNEFHFHEECCEMIFKRLYDILNTDDELLVCALYTRRGGIDISPVRYTSKTQIDDILKLIDITKFARNGLKQ